MSDSQAPSDERLRQAVDAFWESVPPYWHIVRAYIRQAAVEQFQITVEQFHILRHIRRGFHTVKDLAQAKQISPSAVSQAVEVLVQQGMVTRRQDEQDRRNVHLELTAQGSALLDVLFTQTRGWMMDQFKSLDDAELEELARAFKLLKKVHLA